MHWGGFQRQCEVDRTRLRKPQISAGKWWIAPSGLGMICCPKSDGKMEHQKNIQTDVALYRTVVMKRYLSLSGKLSIYQRIYIPTLTYGHHELWIADRMRLQIEAAQMSFLHRMPGLKVGLEHIWRGLRKLSCCSFATKGAS